MDLFCGAGGLTRGLEDAGVDVRLGVDIDPACAYPYRTNNPAGFLLGSVADLDGRSLTEAWAGASFSMLAGCAPCQPFSTYQRTADPADKRRTLLQHFGRLVQEAEPDFVVMENVPRLARQAVFHAFVEGLEAGGYHVHHEVVRCAEFGVPQTRQRLVLLASRLGPIGLRRPPLNETQLTVRQVIGALPPIVAGGACKDDPLHWACTLSDLNMRRIRASVPGGTWRDWDEELLVDCHQRDSGKYYSSVYGRMSWDEPAPTITTQFYGFGNGRFGHPEQDRAISLREGALLQGFPAAYEFAPPGSSISRSTVGRLIGNAVPVALARAIGRSVLSEAVAKEQVLENAA